jgi:hypothetical protein
VFIEHYYISYEYIGSPPISVAVWSKAWTFFARSNSGIVGSKPTKGMGVCCLYAFILCLGRGLATGWSLVRGVLPSVINDYGTEWEAWALNGLEEPFKKYIRHSFLCAVYSAFHLLLLVSCLVFSSTSKMRVILSSETSVYFYRIICHYNSDDNNHHPLRAANPATVHTSQNNICVLH